MDHLKRITEEFTRQAETFATWAENVDADVGARFGGALDEAARGRLIDIACGPGVVTAALAPNAASVVAFDATDEM
ncbi:MAG: methyltransferase type 11, partial [Terriglobia bacterium]